MIRPERLFVIRDEIKDPGRTIVFDGVVSDFVFQGETAFALVAVGGEYELSVRFGTRSSSEAERLQTGDRISLGLDRADVIVVPGKDGP